MSYTHRTHFAFPESKLFVRGTSFLGCDAVSLVQQFLMVQQSACLHLQPLHPEVQVLYSFEMLETAHPLTKRNTTLHLQILSNQTVIISKNVAGSTNLKNST
jgi:hypothetical protein